MIESLMGSLGGDNLGALMGMLGDGADAPSDEAAKGAIGTGVGAILKGLAKNASEPQGAESLFNAVTGDVDNAVVFAGSNVPRVKEVVSVQELLEGLASEASDALDRQ